MSFEKTSTSELPSLAHPKDSNRLEKIVYKANLRQELFGTGPQLSKIESKMDSEDVGSLSIPQPKYEEVDVASSGSELRSAQHDNSLNCDEIYDFWKLIKNGLCANLSSYARQL